MIIDRYGQPFNFEQALQTEKSEALSKVARRAPEHPTSGLTPASAASMLADAETGNLRSQAYLAQDMQVKNGHIFSEISKRRRAVTLLDWTLVPPANPTPQEQKDCDLLNEILSDADWLNDLIFHATDAILKGYSCQEIEWINEEKLIIPRAIHFRSQAMFKTAKDNPNLLLLDDGLEGQTLNPFGWVVHKAPAMSGYISELSLARVLVWPFIFHSYPTRDLLEFLEIYGLPLRLGKYQPAATEAEKNTLLKAVLSIGHNAGGIIPRGMDIEFHSAANGESTQFLNVMEWAEKTISKIILGGTLTSQADGKTSTNALGDVHDKTRIELRNSDIAQLEPTITRDLIYPLWVLNAKSFSNHRRCPRFVFDISEPDNVTTYATALPALVNMGLKIPQAWVHDKLQIPIADDQEPTLATVPTVPAFLKRAALKTDIDRQFHDGLDHVNDVALIKAIDPMIKLVVDAINQGGLDNAKNLIAEMYDTKNTAALTKILTQAIFVADLWGRVDDNT